VLAMLAHAFLSVLTAATAPDPQANHDPVTTGQPCLIPLTRNEIRRLFTTAVRTLRSL
jgi:hypothetical protein